LVGVSVFNKKKWPTAQEPSNVKNEKEVFSKIIFQGHDISTFVMLKVWKLTIKKSATIPIIVVIIGFMISFGFFFAYELNL
jgi:hypothetical protein